MTALEHLAHARLAVAVLAARQRGETGTAADVMGAFPDAASMAAGFVTVAELALQVSASRGGPPPLEVLQEIGHGLAASEVAHRSEDA